MQYKNGLQYSFDFVKSTSSILKQIVFKIAKLFFYCSELELNGIGYIWTYLGNGMVSRYGCSSKVVRL